MWFKKNIAVVVEPEVAAPKSHVVAVAEVADVAVTAVPLAVAADPEMEVDELAEYIKVAESLGLSEQPALLGERMERFLADENIHVFDRRQVWDHLNKQFGANGWEWRGVRQQDVEHLTGWNTTVGGMRIDFSDRVYARAIPLPVLLTMKKIADAFPSVCFYVSNPKSTDGDPFLYATTRDVTGFIVERWDEPDFRER